MDQEVKDNKIKSRFAIARKTALISGAFFLLLSVLLITNYIQTRSVDPLNSKALTKLMKSLQENPDNNELKEQIRELDLLARKAYFTNQWQIKTGSVLLIIFAAAFLFSFKSLSSLKRQFPDLAEKINEDSSWENKIMSKKYFAYTGFAIFSIALFAGLFTETNLENTAAETADKKVIKGNNETVKTEETLTEEIVQPVAIDINKIRQNWPQFRGPEGIGIVYNNPNAPVEWNGKTGDNIVWKTPVPLKGFNSPIIWEGKIFLSGSDDKNQAVYCFNFENGKLLWEHKLNDIPGTPKPKPEVMEYTGYAAPSMATDGINVFVIFGTGDIACIDFAGKRKWAKNLGSPKNHYGHSSSLAVFGNILLVQYDQNSGAQLFGLNTESGAQIYSQKRDIQISWASPILVQTGTRTEAVLSANPFVISHDPATGKELWRFKCMSGEIGPSPAYADGVVYVCNDYARLAGIKLGAKPTLLWETDEDLSEISSPVATKDIVVMAASFGTVSCWDAKTGKRLWTYESDQGFYSSPIIANGKIYLMDISGLMHILKADKKLEELGTCELGEKASTTPAFYKNKIIIRGENNLYCIGK